MDPQIITAIATAVTAGTAIVTAIKQGKKIDKLVEKIDKIEEENSALTLMRSLGTPLFEAELGERKRVEMIARKQVRKIRDSIDKEEDL